MDREKTKEKTKACNLNDDTPICLWALTENQYQSE